MKGSILDILFVMMLMFGIAITLLVAFWAQDKLTNSSLNQTVGDSEGHNWTTAMSSVQAGLNVFQVFFLFIFVATLISAIGLSFYVEAHPAFFVFSFFMLIIEIVVGAMLTNLFYDIATSAMFAPVANGMTVLVVTMEQQPLIILVFGGLMLILLYAKFGRGQERTGA